jgi:hypothetical protein
MPRYFFDFTDSASRSEPMKGMEFVDLDQLSIGSLSQPRLRSSEPFIRPRYLRALAIRYSEIASHDPASRGLAW